MADHYLIILSLLRIIATVGIFFFHLLGLYNFNNRYLDFYSILIFCFLSGFFGIKIKNNPKNWLIRRFYSILVPYWLVIFPVLIINRYIHYKNTTLVEDLITFLGGNLFLVDPVYVIGWYITFVLLLYVCLFFYYELTMPIKYIFLIFSFFLFIRLGKIYYYCAFWLGFVFSNFFLKKTIIPSSANKFYNIIFLVQSHCYAFFLVHGGILLANKILLNYSFKQALLNGFIFSGVAAFFLKKMSDFLSQILRDKLRQITV